MLAGVIDISVMMLSPLTMLRVFGQPDPQREL